MTAVAVALSCLLALAAIIAWLVTSATRSAAALARTTALSQAEAQTIKNFRDRQEIDREVNADADLVARARSVMHHPAPK